MSTLDAIAAEFLAERNPRKSTSEKVEVMKAYIDGRQIQSRHGGAPDTQPWRDCSGIPAWAWDRFVYRIAPPAPDAVPWAAIPNRHKWYARDKSGDIWLYEDEPQIPEGGQRWMPNKLSAVNVAGIIAAVAGELPWGQSKQKRPDPTAVIGVDIAASGSDFSCISASPPPPRR